MINLFRHGKPRDHHQSQLLKPDYLLELLQIIQRLELHYSKITLNNQ